MTQFRPKFITFDCYGTLTNFQMAGLTREIFSDRVPADRMDAFISDFKSYRFDEILGDWKPYNEVLYNAIERTCRLWDVSFTEEEGNRYYEAVPTWGPHPDVTEPLVRVAKHIPLVILSNAMDSQIHTNVEKLGAPFHAVFTAQQAQAYKPRLRAFEYMLDELGCGPGDILHVSASLRYDLMSAHDLRVENKVFVNRGFEPSTPYYGYTEIKHIGGLPGVVGL